VSLSSSPSFPRCSGQLHHGPLMLAPPPLKAASQGITPRACRPSARARAPPPSSHPPSPQPCPTVTHSTRTSVSCRAPRIAHEQPVARLQHHHDVAVALLCVHKYHAGSALASSAVASPSCVRIAARRCGSATSPSASPPPPRARCGCGPAPPRCTAPSRRWGCGTSSQCLVPRASTAAAQERRLDHCTPITAAVYCRRSLARARKNSVRTVS
jgi:hypothetical protein